MQFAALVFVAAAAAAVEQFIASIKCGAMCVCVKFVVRKCSSSEKMRLDQPNDDNILSEEYCEGAVRHWCHCHIVKSTIATKVIHLIELCCAAYAI